MDNKKITCIELFDISPVENICIALTGKADRLILFGEKKKFIEKAYTNYRKIIEKRKINTEIEIVSVNSCNLCEITDALEKAVTENSSLLKDEFDECKICIIDITGGSDLDLVAAGIIYERYCEKRRVYISGSYSDINKNINTNYGSCEKALTDNMLPKITVDEYFEIAGAKIKKYKTWELNDDFIRDTDKIFDVSTQNPDMWNTQIKKIQSAYKKGKQKNRLDFIIEKSTVENCDNVQGSFGIFINKLIDSGLILNKGEENGYLKLRFKDSQVKECLLDEGKILEVKVYIAAVQAKKYDKVSKTKNKIYNDVKNGVEIDLDGEGERNTNNEIDVMAMHGITPVYISCKNGKFDSEEMYKLNTVAGRFGRKYAKLAIIATDMEKFTPMQQKDLKERAENIGICLFDYRRKKDVDDYESIEKYNRRLEEFVRKIFDKNIKPE